MYVCMDVHVLDLFGVWSMEHINTRGLKCLNYG